jgi:hypothetical protein
MIVCCLEVNELDSRWSLPSNILIGGGSYGERWTPPTIVCNNLFLSFQTQREILVPSKGRDLKDSSHSFGMTFHSVMTQPLLSK